MNNPIRLSVLWDFLFFACSCFGVLIMVYFAMNTPKLDVRLFRTDSGNVPVRDWLKELHTADRKIIGEDIKTV